MVDTSKAWDLTSMGGFIEQLKERPIGRIPCQPGRRGISQRIRVRDWWIRWWHLFSWCVLCHWTGRWWHGIASSLWLALAWRNHEEQVEKKQKKTQRIQRKTTDSRHKQIFILTHLIPLPGQHLCSLLPPVQSELASEQIQVLGEVWVEASSETIDSGDNTHIKYSNIRLPFYFLFLHANISFCLGLLSCNYTVCCFMKHSICKIQIRYSDISTARW